MSPGPGPDPQRQKSSSELGAELARQLTGPELTGFGMSFLLHLALLLGLALVILERMRPGSPAAITISTVEAINEYVPAPSIDLELELVAEESHPAAGPPIISLPAADFAKEIDRTLEQVSPSGAGGPPGSARSERSREGGSTLPRNAVEIGSFAAWWIPVAERYGEKVEAGQLPRIQQPYHIHLQIRVPNDKPVFPLNDLSGEIVGTDGYRQPIPDRAWIIDDDGKLTRSVGHRYAKVRGGVVEIVFKVEGAGVAGIRDTISVQSRMLQEEQMLTLEFQSADAAAP